MVLFLSITTKGNQNAMKVSKLKAEQITLCINEVLAYLMESEKKRNETKIDWFLQKAFCSSPILRITFD